MNNQPALAGHVRSTPLQTAKGPGHVPGPLLLRALLVGARSPLGGSPCPRRRPRPPQSYKRLSRFCMASMSYKIYLVVWLGRLGCASVWRSAAAGRARAARCARPAPPAPSAFGRLGGLGRARALRWGPAGGVPPPAGGGCALGHSAASGAQPSPAALASLAMVCREEFLLHQTGRRCNNNPSQRAVISAILKLQGAAINLATHVPTMAQGYRLRAAQKGGSLLILILYVLFVGEGVNIRG